MFSRRSLLVLLSTLGALPARAAGDTAARKYVVLALIGDALTIVSYQVSVGTRLDKNTSQTLPLTDGGFDHSALAAAVHGLRRADPAATTVLLAGKTPEHYASQTGLIDGDRLVAPPWLADVLRTEGATHLLLVTKHRAEADLRAAYNRLGTGWVSGLGFFIDGSTQMTNIETGYSSRGFVAPYAYLRVALVDVASGALVDKRLITASRVSAAVPDAKGVGPWNALTSEQKVAMLDDMIEIEVGKAVASLATAAAGPAGAPLTGNRSASGPAPS